jgi:hypothetical protein
VSRANVTIDIDDETDEVTVHLIGEGYALAIAHNWVTVLKKLGLEVDIDQQPQTIN